MLSLWDLLLRNSSSNLDDVTYMTGVTHVQPWRQENGNASVKLIEESIASNKNRLRGLCMLKSALDQNFDVYEKSNWSQVLIALLEEPITPACKETIHHLFTFIITTWGKDVNANQEKMANLFQELHHVLFNHANSKMEFKTAAFGCLSAIAKFFPVFLIRYKSEVLHLILRETYNVFSKKFEIYAECFCHLPSVQKTIAPEMYADSWTDLYKRLLDAMKRMLNSLLTYIPQNEQFDVPDDDVFDYNYEDDPEDKDVIESSLTAVRRFICFCKLLSKMLSTKSKYAVQVPLQLTLECIIKLFMIEEISKLTPTSVENQILLSALTQLQTAALCLLEPIVTNFGSHAVPFSGLIIDILRRALLLSKCSNITKEAISQIRLVVWKLIQVWLNSQSAKGVAYRIFKDAIMKELLNDISIQEKPPEASVDQENPGRSSKNAATNADCKNNSVNQNLYFVCVEALKALKKLLYGGGCFIDNKMFQEISSKLFHIAHAIHPYNETPFPYTNEECRKNVYSALLALAVVSKSPQMETLQIVIAIFENARSDSSNKVISVCYKAAAVCRVALHPRKSPPLVRVVEDRPSLAGPSNEDERLQVYDAEENYIENLPPVQELPSEDMPCHIASSYQVRDTDMNSSDYAHADIPYSEQVNDNQCNGDEVLELQNASHSQEEEESEEEGAYEDEDEDPCYDEDLPEEVDLPAEHLYIPNADELHVGTNAHIPEIVQTVDSDYQELRPSTSKFQGNAFGTNNNKCVNGVHSSMPDGEIGSGKNLTNENGNYTEDEEGEEEEEDEEEDGDEEEEAQHRTAEKRVPDLIDAPVSKKQKLDGCSVVEVREDGETDPRSESPNVEQMKKDFHLSDGEDVDEKDVKKESVKS